MVPYQSQPLLITLFNSLASVYTNEVLLTRNFVVFFLLILILLMFLGWHKLNTDDSSVGDSDKDRAKSSLRGHEGHWPLAITTMCFSVILAVCRKKKTLTNVQALVLDLPPSIRSTVQENVTLTLAENPGSCPSIFPCSNPRMGIRAKSNFDRSRTIWTPEMDRYFIDLMLEQLNKGNRFDDHVFSKTAWMNMNSSFNERFKNLYKAVKNLLNQKGFNWDSTRQMVIAENKIWDEYIKDLTGFLIYR
ncbi:hypothetical protein ERO13_D08G051332v2 [Gossypium hirsutum]|uniref:Myb/SANT-like domain-containing protein n=1 Tax=Gossypium tomentosum TaxID=34277 RepID=A0A5D2JSM6_GOSTO|nr:hypothetical protein ERO13_D08G051332v2 [Gossypium hirsutum]TYH56913.1 hypothetical protein ES332_D08G053700v1 [Gossypium tomentosum]